jgi:enoyl-[acyl-carrier protein] reductase I
MTPFSLNEKSVTLAGKKGLVVGIANEDSLAFGCAKAFRGLGADLAITYVEKSERWVRPLAEQLDSQIIMPCNVQDRSQVAAVFERIKREWGRLNFLLHSVAFAPKEDLHARVVDCSAEGFAMAMDISCHSFIRMAHLAEPLMTNGGCLLAMTYYGAEKVIDHYNLMGPVKAALESAVRYMAYELGPKNIRVHAISPGPVKTRAASGIDRFDELLDKAAEKAPQHQLVDIDDVGAVAAFLVGDWAKAMSGNIAFVDAGYHVVG